jgi:hypothetical protein
VDIGDRVFKFGRTTLFTRGMITAFGLDNLPVNYAPRGQPPRIYSFDNQIEIVGRPGLPFSRGGDSGSLILDAGRRAVALLFAGSDETGVTYANPIHAVLSWCGGQFWI